mgnify:CR=1 FL=1
MISRVRRGILVSPLRLLGLGVRKNPFIYEVMPSILYRVKPQTGLHVTIFCFGIFRLLLICRLPRRISILATISFLISYGLMTGFSISTSRAVIMMLLLFAADLLHRSYDLLSSLAISACIITLQNPYAVYSCSFLLSYFAVLGLSLIHISEPTRPY